MPLAEDLAFTLDYIYYIDTVIFSSEKGYLYRRHQESVTQKNDIRPYYVYLSCFYHLYNSMMRYIERKNLKNRDQIKRKKHIGGNLFYAILSLYLNKMPRKERLFHLKKDFSKQQYSLLNYKPFGFSIKQLVCIPLVLGFYSTFDFIVSLIVKAKYTN